MTCRGPRRLLGGSRRPLGDEISECLTFDGLGADKLDVESAKLDSPFSHPTGGLAVPEDTLQGIGGNHPDCMRLKIMAQLSGRNKDCVEHLLYRGVPCLSVSEYFADIVHRALDAHFRAHPPGLA